MAHQMEVWTGKESMQGMMPDATIAGVGEYGERYPDNKVFSGLEDLGIWVFVLFLCIICIGPSLAPSFELVQETI
jgi:hypothetical protein